MMKNTLETLLRARLADSRAMVGSLDINHDRVLLHFGAIGDLPRVTLSINDNETSIAVPDVLAVEWRLGEEAKRSRTALDPAVPLTAAFDGDKLTAGGGGPEIILPETFYEYVAGALLTGEGDEDEPDVANGATAAETGAGVDGVGANPKPVSSFFCDSGTVASKRSFRSLLTVWRASQRRAPFCHETET